MSGKGRIIVGLSGGVDSAVAALLLREQGFEPIGLTLRLHGCTDVAGDKRSCCGPDAGTAAGAVAAQLGMRHYVLDSRDVFERRVLRPSLRTFEHGGTPNPCILCNARVRFDRLVEFADQMGAVGAATGHYARLEHGDVGGVRLLRGVDPSKDQTYFLHAISPLLLARMRFPLGELLKTDVREIARKHGLVSASRRESQDICFTGPEGHFGEHLLNHFGGRVVPGVIRNRDGQVIGSHEGIHRFTVGQRRGLGVAAGVPMRVMSVDELTGDVVVTDDARDLRETRVTARLCHWLNGPPVGGGFTGGADSLSAESGASGG